MRGEARTQREGGGETRGREKGTQGEGRKGDKGRGGGDTGRREGL